MASCKCISHSKCLPDGNVSKAVNRILRTYLLRTKNKELETTGRSNIKQEKTGKEKLASGSARPFLPKSHEDE